MVPKEVLTAAPEKVSPRAIGFKILDWKTVGECRWATPSKVFSITQNYNLRKIFMNKCVGKQVASKIINL